MKKLFIFTGLFMAILVAESQTIRYVRPTPAGAGNDTLLSGEQNKEYIVFSADKMDAGRYYVEAFGACGNAKSHTITIDVGSTNIFVEKWHDVILVDNSSWKYVGYQWYRNGKIINGATNQFYQEIGGLKGCYSVELTQIGGGKIQTCERCFDKTTKSGVSVYPNPTTGQLRVSGDISDDKDRNIVIFDIVGQVVFTSRLSELSPETTIDISHLANGMYFFKIDNKMYKIVKN